MQLFTFAMDHSKVAFMITHLTVKYTSGQQPRWSGALTSVFLRHCFLTLWVKFLANLSLNGNQQSPQSTLAGKVVCLISREPMELQGFKGHFLAQLYLRIDLTQSFSFLLLRLWSSSILRPPTCFSFHHEQMIHRPFGSYAIISEFQAFVS